MQEEQKLNFVKRQSCDVVKNIPWTRLLQIEMQGPAPKTQNPVTNDGRCAILIKI